MSLSSSIIGHFSLFLEHPIFNSSSTFLCEFTEYIFCFEGNVLLFLNIAVSVLTVSSLHLRAPSAFPSPSCMVVVWLLKWAQYKCDTTQLLSSCVERKEWAWMIQIFVCSWKADKKRKKHFYLLWLHILFCHAVCSSSVTSVFHESFDRVNKADRLEENYLALLSFVSSHCCCSPVFSYLGVFSVLSCS